MELTASLELLEVLANTAFQMRNVASHDVEGGQDIKRRHVRFCCETLHLLFRLMLRMVASQEYNELVLSRHDSASQSIVDRIKAALDLEDAAFAVLRLWLQQCQGDLNCKAEDDPCNCPHDGASLHEYISRYMKDAGEPRDLSRRSPIEWLQDLHDHLRRCDNSRDTPQNFEVGTRFAATLAKELLVHHTLKLEVFSDSTLLDLRKKHISALLVRVLCRISERMPPKVGITEREDRLESETTDCRRLCEEPFVELEVMRKLVQDSSDSLQGWSFSNARQEKISVLMNEGQPDQWRSFSNADGLAGYASKRHNALMHHVP
mmetsp:Transcript_15385/g.39749  ORF Transcript_15385/g.39749 Transcript_15385/m.39749 type:complete len:319 (+) Transcript_15385:1-957(+)